MPETNGAPLMENPHVKELLSIMQENNADSSNLMAMISHVAAMEKYLESANHQLTAMRQELADMREIQKHPIKTALQNSINALETKINAMTEKLNHIKAAIIEGCKNAVAAFKEKGASVLNGVMSFFHIKQGLQSLQKDCDSAIKTADNAIVNIRAFSEQYHEAGKAFRNMGRALIGKDAIKEAKPVGKLANFMAAPYKLHRSAMDKLKGSIGKAISRLEQLDSNVTARKDEKRSLLERLDENKARVKKESIERPTPARVKATGEMAV